ncbi:hypothetical protein SB861_40185 [Paraburkholderia sp. SIMBA_049]
MRTLTQADFLALWENGRTLHPIDRGLLVIHAAFPETQRESVADWPIGRRNRALAELRCASFGAALRGWTACRRCAEQLEFELDGHALSLGAPPRRDEPIAVAGHAFRLPTSRDLAAIAAEPDPADAALRLLTQCRVDGPAQSPLDDGFIRELTREDIDAIGEQMALADPLAEIALLFDCPACGESFQESLDLVSFLWAEIEGRAKRLLLDVHALATAYGWSETEILSISAARREFYLDMVGA